MTYSIELDDVGSVVLSEDDMYNVTEEFLRNQYMEIRYNVQHASEFLCYMLADAIRHQDSEALHLVDQESQILLFNDIPCVSAVADMLDMFDMEKPSEEEVSAYISVRQQDELVEIQENVSEFGSCMPDKSAMQVAQTDSVGEASLAQQSSLTPAALDSARNTWAIPNSKYDTKITD